MGLTNNLKDLYERIPKGVKFVFAPIFIRLMVKNKEFQHTWKQLDYFESLSESQKREFQLNSLKKVLQYAYDNVPYYRSLFDEYDFKPSQFRDFSDLKILPFLEKAEAIQAGKTIYSTDEKLKYYKTFTGGSSGQALTVLLDKSSIYRERACVTHFLSKFGYDPLKTKTVAFWGHNQDQDFYYSPLKNEIVISPFRLYQKNQFDAICKDIEKFGATFVMGYPSAIYLFAQMAEANSKKLKFDHVVYYAENCSLEEKDYIERVFNCKVDSYYGHTERACFAEISEDGCKFNDFYGYTELIPTDQPNEYRIVCTGFLRKKMPLIRYATDDVVHILPDGKMVLVGHKRSEIHLISKNGQHVFKGAMTLHIEELKKIKRYQYIQNEKGKVQLCVVENEPLTKDELKIIQNYISRRCEGLLDVEIKVVDELILTTRGKFNWAVCNIKDKE